MRIQDVVLVVRDVHGSLPAAGTIPIPVQQIKSLLVKKYGFEFELFHSVSWEPKSFAGRLYRYNRNGKCVVKIVVSNELNFCWTRYVACKELAHLLIDKDDDFVKDPITLISLLVDGIVTAEKDISSENCAMVAAAELLIPWGTRQTIYDMVAAGNNNYHIALAYRVPEKVIEFWRSPRYQTVLADAWKDI